jgi:hypothetical protein
MEMNRLPYDFIPVRRILELNREMINIEDRFFSLNRILLLAVGLWPYQKAKLARFHLICCFSALASLIIFQVGHNISIILIYNRM